MTSRGHPVLLAIVVVTLLSACGIAEQIIQRPRVAPPPTLPSHGGPPGLGADALRHGRLASEGTCVWLEALGGERTSLLWPVGSTLRGTVIFLEDQRAASIGQFVSLRGGLSDILAPAECRPGRDTWAVAEILPFNPDP